MYVVPWSTEGTQSRCCTELPWYDVNAQHEGMSLSVCCGFGLGGCWQIMTGSWLFCMVSGIRLNLQDVRCGPAAAFLNGSYG